MGHATACRCFPRCHHAYLKLGTSQDAIYADHHSNSQCLPPICDLNRRSSIQINLLVLVATSSCTSTTTPAWSASQDLLLLPSHRISSIRLSWSLRLLLLVPVACSSASTTTIWCLVSLLLVAPIPLVTSACCTAPIRRIVAPSASACAVTAVCLLTTIAAATLAAVCRLVPTILLVATIALITRCILLVSILVIALVRRATCWLLVATLVAVLLLYMPSMRHLSSPAAALLLALLPCELLAALLPHTSNTASRVWLVALPHTSATHRASTCRSSIP